MQRRLGLAFDRCYSLDEDSGPTPRPGFLSPAGLLAAGMIVMFCFAVLLATTYWDATAAHPTKAAPPAARTGIAASPSR